MRLTYTFIHSLLLSAVLVIYPVILPAVQSDGQILHGDPQVLSESYEIAQKPSVLTPPDAYQMSSQRSSNLSDAHALDEETTLAQQNEEKANEFQDTAPVESENYYEEAEEEVHQIPDPLAPVNKVMFHVNDKLYFWVLKPVTQAYSHIIPEDFRIVFSNAYDNLWAPSRMLNHLLQFRVKPAGNELIRFLVNSVIGVGGLGDVAGDSFGIKKQEADFGQTLGHYGLSHGLYLVLPVYGPSSLRDGVGLAGDLFMHPLTYVSRSDLSLGELYGIFAHENVNDTSFRIGDYEAFRESAIDPYVSMRDAFVQHRKMKVEESNR